MKIKPTVLFLLTGIMLLGGIAGCTKGQEPPKGQVPAGGGQVRLSTPQAPPDPDERKK